MTLYRAEIAELQSAVLKVVSLARNAHQRRESLRARTSVHWSGGDGGQPPSPFSSRAAVLWTRSLSRSFTVFLRLSYSPSSSSPISSTSRVIRHSRSSMQRRRAERTCPTCSAVVRASGQRAKVTRRSSPGTWWDRKFSRSFWGGGEEL